MSVPADQISLRLCPSCGHDLTGSPSLVCPECGRVLAVLADAQEESASAAPARSTAPGPSGGAAPALGSHAAKGFTFMLAQGIGTRIITFACQLWLSYLLLPEHFGTMAIADSIAMFANILQMIGVREILVSRQKRFHLWANPGFWIMTSTGWTTALLLAAAAPLAARAYGSADLAGVMLVLALSIPLYSMSAVAEAKLQIDLRFKRLALIAAVWATLIPTLTVAFALLGFGVYSFAIPRVVAGVVRLAMAHTSVRLPLRLRPQVRRWRYIVGTSVLLFFTSLLLLVAQIGDRPMLSLLVGEHEVGLYAFAFAFSLQTIMMIAVNLQQILFATLARLNDEPERQLSAFLRASRVLAAIVTPICLLQSAASEPLIRTVFNHDRWKDAVPAMQLLALGMVFLGAYSAGLAMIEAQRRFRTKFRLAVLTAAVFVVLVPLGAWAAGRWGFPGVGTGPLGSVAGAAAAVSLANALLNPLWAFVAIRPMGGTWSDTLGVVTRPILAAGLAVALGLLAARAAAAMVAGRSLAGIPLEHWTRLATIVLVTGAAYVPLARVLMPTEYREIAQKLVAAARRASPRAAGAFARLAGV